jgi:hypothetical protein
LPVLESTHVNTSLEALSYRLSSQQHDALRDLLRFYSPTSGPIRKVATYLGPGGGFHVNVGHSSYFDLDRVFQLATGLLRSTRGAPNNCAAEARASRCLTCSSRRSGRDAVAQN